MDSRIELRFGLPGGLVPPETAVLVEGHGDLPDLAGAAVVVQVSGRAAAFAGCACCVPRGQAAQALGRLFTARARGEVPFFRQVVVITSHEADIRDAIARDVVAAARYRISP